MSHKFLLDANFHLLLTAIDQEMAKEAQQQGCMYCGNKLHQADYPRSPIGLPPLFRNAYSERFSFCCHQCRRRTTPKSVRFFGRRWYPAPLFMLICVLAVGMNERRLAQVRQHFGITVSESTWKRWRRWWRDSFELAPFWQQHKGLVPAAIVSIYRYPRALLIAFKGLLDEKMRLLLRFLSPLTGGILRAV